MKEYKRIAGKVASVAGLTDKIEYIGAEPPEHTILYDREVVLLTYELTEYPGMYISLDYNENDNLTDLAVVLKYAYDNAINYR